jgi:two-component system phosphate regulon sensor histidine kinase PhoR
MRVYPRLLVAVLAPALLSLAIGLPLLWSSLTGVAERAVASDLDATLSILVPMVNERLAGPEVELQAWAREVVRHPSLRLTIISDDGRVLADSERSAAQVAAMDNHGQRPEVMDARNTGRGVSRRRSATLGIDFVYVAQAMAQPDGTIAVARLAKPLSALTAMRQGMARLLWIVLLVSLATVMAVAMWLNVRLFRPLGRLAEAADRMSRGEYSQRVASAAEDSIERVGNSLNRLALRVEEQIRVADAERGHLEVVGASMTEGILVTDAEGRALLVNPAFRKLFRIKGEVKGRTAVELIFVPEIDDIIRATLDTGQTRALELELSQPRRRWVAVTSSLLRDATGVVVAARDISDLVHMGEVRRDLVANVSHELKTPLTAIRGYAETLQDGADADPEVRERFVGRILQQCARLQALLDDLLTLSRLESSQQESDFEQVDFAGLLQDTVEVLGSVAREKEVRVGLGVPEGLRIEGDRVALEELCLNLMDNAIKYNRLGGEVKVQVRSEDGFAILEVADTGRGIPQDALPRLFERFYRVDRGRARNEGGTGLGLAIVKHAVKIHHGEIAVTSELGRGSTFTARLPLRQGPNQGVQRGLGSED